MYNLLDNALNDKKLTPLEFRTLYYIVLNIDSIYHEQLKNDLGINTNITLSKTIKKLISLGYISRTKKNTINKKGVGSFHYMITTSNKTLSLNNNDIKKDKNPVLSKKDTLPKKEPLKLDNNKNIDFHSQAYFSSIDKLYSYFFDKIPLSHRARKISTQLNKKEMAYLVEFDKYPIRLIEKVIDFVSTGSYSKKIDRPSSLRKNFKDILFNMGLKDQIKEKDSPIPDLGTIERVKRNRERLIAQGVIKVQ